VKVDALVLAGGDGAVIDPTVSIKGLVPIAGRPMIEWVVKALRDAETIGEIAVAVPTTEDLGDWVSLVDHLVVSEGSFMDNAVAGLSVFSGERPVLGATGDLPALTPEAIDDFVNRSLEAGAQISYPLVPAEDMEAQFPGSQRTYVRVSGGRVTGGNVMVVAPEAVRDSRVLIQRLFDARKSPVGMAKVLGLRFIFRYITGHLRVTDVERKMGELLGVHCVAIYTPFASIGADVDKPLDVVVAQRVLYARDSGRNSANSAEY
jgi:GTP:adenosylcobinamide-phosphate guanylyltransferase